MTTKSAPPRGDTPTLTTLHAIDGTEAGQVEGGLASPYLGPPVLPDTGVIYLGPPGDWMMNKNP